MAVDYQLVHVNRVGHEHTQPYRSETELSEGDLVHVEGRDWLVDAVDGEQVRLEPARYRLVLRHPDGRAESGAFRRYRADAPRVGQRSARSSTASRQLAGRRRPALSATSGQAVPRADRGARLREAEDAPDLPGHELEHALAREDDRDEAVATLARAEESGQLVELVALEPGEAPDWDEAGRYIDALILEEIEDDLVVLCGVDTERTRRRPGSRPSRRGCTKTCAASATDIESGHDQIEEWDFRDGRMFASIGSFDDQANPDSGHGWLSRLVDSSASAAAGFSRVRKA